MIDDVGYGRGERDGSPGAVTAPLSQADDITMSAGGLYSLATRGAKDVIDRATPQVLAALGRVPAPEGRHWSFADLGCADGGTSLDLWRAVCRRVRERSDADVQIVHADQPRNDFNALVRILHGLSDFRSYLSELDGVHALQSGASFYTPVLPAGSLHLGFSATAMHWLSRKPRDIADHVHMVGASGEELAAFAAQAASDWRCILLHRARELVPGGRLVLVNFCRDERGRYLGNTGGVNMFDTLARIWRELVADGIVSAEELARMTLPQYYNSVDELVAPFEDETGAIRASGLELERIETATVRCPFAEAFRQHRDAARFAAEYVPTVRSWNESVFRGALSTERAERERAEIVETFYERYRAEVERTPDGHGMDYVHAYMTIAKRPV